MSHQPTNQALESLVREYLLEKETYRAELNALLRNSEEARAIAARALFEEAALISELRLAGVKKWAGTLHPRTINEITQPKATQKKHSSTLAYALAIAACIALSAIIFTQFATDKSPPKVAVAETKNPAIGTIRLLEHSDDSITDRTILENSEFTIASGRARIDLDNGVALSVTGPARLRIARNVCRLWTGQLAVEVPENLPQFVVLTDDSRFVDMGTIFTVSAQPNKNTEMAVIGGLVRAEIVSTEGDILAKQLVRKDQGVIVQPEKGEFKVVRADILAHSAPISITDPPLSVPPAYRSAVTAAKPLLVWNFESQLDPSSIKNPVSPNFQAKIHGHAITRESNDGNHYIILGSTNQEGWVEATEPWSKQDNSPFTVEFWVRPDRIHQGSLFNLLEEPGFDPVITSNNPASLSYFTMMFTQANAFHQPSKEPSLRCGLRNPPTQNPDKTTPNGLNVKLYSAARYLPGKWYHYVMRVDESGCSLFINGQQVDHQSQPLPHFGNLDLVIRVGALRNGIMHRQFYGAIDEIAIYPHALSTEEINKHYKIIRKSDPTPPGN